MSDITLSHDDLCNLLEALDHFNNWIQDSQPVEERTRLGIEFRELRGRLSAALEAHKN